VKIFEDFSPNFGEKTVPEIIDNRGITIFGTAFLFVFLGM
jgi:hypothetical protein